MNNNPNTTKTLDHQDPRPLILEIKGNSLDDGPGIRSVVFFKGCPLTCVWCHNPESKNSLSEISFDAGACAGCDTCLATCTRQALSRDNPYFIDRARCDLCFDCTKACPSGALDQIGREMSMAAITADILKDKLFFETSGGGVTFSGGEPTLNMPFLSRLLKSVRNAGVHALLETCGLYSGYQCGMIWGAALGAGAQAYRLLGPGSQAESRAIIAAQRLVEVFHDRQGTINCHDITNLNASSTHLQMVNYFVLKGGTIGCFRMAAGYAPDAFSAIDAIARFRECTDYEFECASIVGRKFASPDDHTGYLQNGGCAQLIEALATT